jgi:hypothetical protein
MDDLPASVADHKPCVQQPEPNGGDDQEVHRGDAVPVIAKEGLPTLAWIVVRTSLREVARDGREAERNAELCELCPDLPGSPVY